MEGEAERWRDQLSFQTFASRRNTTPYISRVFALRSPTRDRFQAVKLCSQLVCRTAHDWLPGTFPGTDPSLAKMFRDGNLITRKRSGLLHGTCSRQTLNPVFGLREVWPFNFFDFLGLTVFISSNGEPEGYGVGRESF